MYVIHWFTHDVKNSNKIVQTDLGVQFADLNRTSDKLTVTQDFGLIICRSENDTIVDPSEDAEPRCKFGRSITTISTNLAIDLDSQTEV